VKKHARTGVFSVCVHRHCGRGHGCVLWPHRTSQEDIAAEVVDIIKSYVAQVPTPFPLP
jgi:hypothetical protein